jgi:hypothetical protein
MKTTPLIMKLLKRWDNSPIIDVDKPDESMDYLLIIVEGSFESYLKKKKYEY